MACRTLVAVDEGERGECAHGAVVEKELLKAPLWVL